jgi:asparagine synthase (glutamine-hydrolysing)
VRYLVHGAFAGEDSAYAGIRQLPPAHTLVVRDGVERPRRYWRPWDALLRRDPDQPRTDEQALVRETGRALTESVASRVPAEVPFGVFLSGGVDSGLVAVLAAQAWGRPYPTFSMRLDQRGYDESPLAARVARAIGSEHHEIAMTEREGEEAFTLWASRMDQPLGDPSVLPTWLLARVASTVVPVVLTGEGGDELFAGYPTYLGHMHAGAAARMPAALSALLLSWARRLRPRHTHVSIPLMLERFLSVRNLPPFERHLAWFGTARPEEALAFLSPALRADAPREAALAHARRLERVLSEMGLMRPGREPGLTPYQLLDFETYLPADLLTKVDRCTMAHGVESRAPFLRAALVEHALGLPRSARLRGTTGKWALKQAAAKLLPAEILHRRKQGFSPPFSSWARGPLRGLVLDVLAPARIAAAGVLDPVAVQHLVRAHLEGAEDRGRTLWTLLSMQSWAERWLTRPTAAPATEAGATSAAVHAVDPRRN